MSTNGNMRNDAKELITLALKGDMIDSRNHMRKKYFPDVIEFMLNELCKKNKTLKGKLSTRYCVSGGDSIQTCIREEGLGSLTKIEELFLSPIDKVFLSPAPCVDFNYGFGFGRAFYTNEDDSNLCMGEHYVNAEKALNAAKLFGKIFGQSSTRFDTGNGLLNAAFDHIELSISSLSRHEEFEEEYEKLRDSQKIFLVSVLRWLDTSLPKGAEWDYSELDYCSLKSQPGYNELTQNLKSIVDDDSFNCYEELKRHISIAYAYLCVLNG